MTKRQFAKKISEYNKPFWHERPQRAGEAMLAQLQLIRHHGPVFIPEFEQRFAGRIKTIESRLDHFVLESCTPLDVNTLGTLPFIAGRDLIVDFLKCLRKNLNSGKVLDLGSGLVECWE